MIEAEGRALGTTLAWIELGLALPTVLALLLIVAPYGRHRREVGPQISVRATWILMELPAVIAFAIGFTRVDASLRPLTVIPAACYLLHYLHRSLIFPFRIPGSATRTSPLFVGILGALFNCLNGFTNGLLVRPANAGESLLLIGVGLALFAVGAGINVVHDNMLFALRKDKPAGTKGDYVIPRGKLFNYVSCPNYLGELIEWGGFLLMTRSLGALAFFVYTLANLAPRARSHHRWYREKFGDYPEGRRALIPFVF